MPSHPILVVDDDRDTADTTTQLLAAHGYPARPAYSCTDALITARSASFCSTCTWTTGTGTTWRGV